MDDWLGLWEAIQAEATMTPHDLPAGRELVYLQRVEHLRVETIVALVNLQIELNAKIAKAVGA